MPGREWHRAHISAETKPGAAISGPPSAARMLLSNLLPTATVGTPSAAPKRPTLLVPQLQRYVLRWQPHLDCNDRSRQLVAFHLRLHASLRIEVLLHQVSHRPQDHGRGGAIHIHHETRHSLAGSEGIDASDPATEIH